MAYSWLRSGLLMPSSGLGGLILGTVLAIQHHGQLAFSLTEHVEGETVRRVAAFGIIVLSTTIASRVIASLISASSPWCSELRRHASGSAPTDTEECSDLSTLAHDILGSRLSEKFGDLLGQDVATVAEVVKASLSDPSQKPVTLVEDNQ